MAVKKRKGFILVLCVFLVLRGNGFLVYAEETYREDAEIRIQVKATVPEDFVEPVSIKYEGKNKKDNEVDIILDYEHEYMTVITIPRDLYTLKHNSTAQGYTAECTRAFTVEDAEAEHTYWLPVTVNTDYSSGTEEDGPLNLLVRADFETEDYGSSDISVRYSGTHGNLIVADLNAENGYQTIVQIMKDVYTKEEVSLSGEFHAVAQYSFDLSRADAENYRLDIIVRSGRIKENEADVEDVLLPEETKDSLRETETAGAGSKAENGSQRIAVEISGPEKNDLEGTVYVAYAGKYNVIEAELDESNHYSVVLNVPYDIYELLYITCYDHESLAFETSQEVIQADGSNVMIPVRIFVQDMGGGSLKNILLAVFGIIAVFILYLYLKKRKKNKSEKDGESGSDDFDESLYKEDEFEPDDMEVNLDND